MQPKSSTRLPSGLIAPEQGALAPEQVGQPPVEIERARPLPLDPDAVLAVVLLDGGGGWAPWASAGRLLRGRRRARGRCGQIGGDPVPVVVAFHRLPAGRTQARAQRPDRRAAGPSASVTASGRSASTSTPVSPSRTASGMPPLRPATTGTPHADASASEMPKPSTRCSIRRETPEVDLGAVVQRGQIAVGNVGEEAHPVGDAELRGPRPRAPPAPRRCRPRRSGASG